VGQPPHGHGLFITQHTDGQQLRHGRLLLADYSSEDLPDAPLTAPFLKYDANSGLHTYYDYSQIA